MKKGRHRRYEEARALKRHQELDIDEIFDSLGEEEPSTSNEGYSPAFEAWAEEFPNEGEIDEADTEGSGAGDLEIQNATTEDVESEEPSVEDFDK